MYKILFKMGAAKKKVVAQKAIQGPNTGHGITHLTQTMSKKRYVKRIFLTARVRKELFSLNVTLEEFFAASTKATPPSTAKQPGGLAHYIYSF